MAFRQQKQYIQFASCEMKGQQSGRWRSFRHLFWYHDARDGISHDLGDQEHGPILPAILKSGGAEGGLEVLQIALAGRLESRGQGHLPALAQMTGHAEQERAV